MFDRPNASNINDNWVINSAITHHVDWHCTRCYFADYITIVINGTCDNALCRNEYFA
jgi:hypothetical protein